MVDGAGEVREEYLDQLLQQLQVEEEERQEEVAARRAAWGEEVELLGPGEAFPPEEQLVVASAAGDG
jgi:hypothetical protein